MLYFKTLYQKKSPKFECMASWLILGGVLPLAVALVTHHQQGLSYDSFFTPDRIPYLWVIAMGIASLRVKRGSNPWRVIVVLSDLGFLAAAGMSAVVGDIPAIVWPLAVLLLTAKQYSSDMKAAQAKKNAFWSRNGLH